MKGQYRTVKASINNLNLNNQGFTRDTRLISDDKTETPNTKSLLNNLGFQIILDYQSPR